MISNTLVVRSSEAVPPVRARPLARRARLGGNALCITLLLLITAACARPPSEPHPWVSRDGMVEIETHGRGLLFVRPDHQLGRYDHLLIEEVGFRYRKGQGYLSLPREEQIRSILKEAVHEAGSGGIGLVDDAGPCVLSVRFYLTDLELHEPIRKSGSATSFVSSYGEATMVMELSDSLDEEPLARFVQRRRLGGGWEMLGFQDSLSRLDRVVGRSMRDMGQQLRRITPPTSRGWDAQCRGNMTRIAFGSH